MPGTTGFSGEEATNTAFYEIAGIAGLATRYGVTVIVDELYSRLLYAGQAYTHLRATAMDPDKIVTIMGPNTAAFVQMKNDIGTLEPGKLADIVAFPANPLDGYWNMLNATFVVKGGEVVVDKRSAKR